MLITGQGKGQPKIFVYITLAEHWPGKGAAARGLYLLSLGKLEEQAGGRARGTVRTKHTSRTSENKTVYL